MNDEEKKDKTEDKEINEPEVQLVDQSEDQPGNSDEEKVDDNLTEAVTAEASKHKSGQSYLFSFFLLILIGVLAGGGYVLWKELKQNEAELTKINNNAQSQSGQAAGEMASMDVAIKQLQEKQSQQSDALTSLYREKQGGNEDWAIAEIEYLLVIAMHRLLLEEDVATALAAMEAADKRLKDLGNPGLLPVREQLAADMNQLRSVNQADIAGMSIYLAELVDLADDLPLKSEAIEKVDVEFSSDTTEYDNEIDSDPVWKKIPRILWQEIKSLVVIKRAGKVQQALLLPGEEYFLYQNLRLELESARLSVLRSDSENLRASIDLSQSWLQQYFDTDDAAVVNVMETLSQIQAINLEPELPDISSSLESVRAYLREANKDSGNVEEIQTP